MKKICCLIVVLVLALGVFNVSADEVITVYLDNERLEFDVNPVLINNRTLVPMRTIFEALGAQVYWNNDTNTALALKDEEFVSIQIGSSEMETANRLIHLDVPAVLKDSRTLVPLRAVSEAFDCDVLWNGDENRVDIYTDSFVDLSKADKSITEVEVTSGQELINAIGSNKKIILKGEVFDLSFVDTSANPAVLNDLTISRVVNMDIEGNAKIIIDDLYRPVLRFENCGMITLNDFTAGHVQPAPGYQCEGAVIEFENCKDMIIEGCSLYGCGAEGINTYSVSGLTVNKCNIYDCTYAGMWYRDSRDINVISTNIYECRLLSGVCRSDNSSIILDNCKIYENECNAPLIDIWDWDGIASNVTIKNSEIINNKFVSATPDNTTGVQFENCTFKDNIEEK